MARASPLVAVRAVGGPGTVAAAVGVTWTPADPLLSPIAFLARTYTV